MKELVVISGKGGTGKTSVTGSFAVMAETPVLADCDVDAADLHLLFDPEIKEKHPFFSGNEAVVRQSDCTACGICGNLCRFDAVDLSSGVAVIQPAACEGCGVCVDHCPADAIDFPSALCGEWFLSKIRCGMMVHARLGIGAENSGKLVSTVRRQAKEVASTVQAEWIIVDGPPGTGCPVIASLTGADAVLVVTEPTLSGQHDLLRVLELTRHFRTPSFVCVNKWDINAEMSRRIETDAAAEGASVLRRIPYDESVTQAQISRKSVVEFNDGPAAAVIRQIWGDICRQMD